MEGQRLACPFFCLDSNLFLSKRKGNHETRAVTVPEPLCMTRDRSYMQKTRKVQFQGSSREEHRDVLDPCNRFSGRERARYLQAIKV
jgi:hypothetical protein